MSTSETALLHAIRSWDGTAANERPLCGAPPVYAHMTVWHVYVNCPGCRAAPGFTARDPHAPAWRLPETVQDVTEDLRRMKEEGEFPSPRDLASVSP